MPPQPESGDACAISRSVIVGSAVVGHHLVDIEGYSHIKEQLPIRSCVALRPFTVGGHSWNLSYYPNNKVEDFIDFIAVSIEHLCEPDCRSTGEAVEARATLCLLDVSGQPVPSHTKSTGLMNFSALAGVLFHDFINKSWLEESEHLVDDRFSFRCDVVVPVKVRVEENGEEPPLVVVPPSDLHQHFGALLAANDGADVMFQVAGEKFSAHRCVLGARSSVFRAELFGLMKESTDTTAVIHVDDMEADVFRTLLTFIYTDTLPETLNMKQIEETAMAQHLLVAADRYNLQRLKLICEDKLCKNIDTDNVATILALAEQHNCQGLKKACLQFLSSPWTLNDVIATEGFEHLAKSCPSVLKELMPSIFTRVPADLVEPRQKGISWQLMFSSGRKTSYLYAILALVSLCIVLSLKGGNAPLSCLCLVAAFLCGFKY